MAISLKGFNSNAVTFSTYGTVNEGDPVCMSSNLTVTAAADETAFCGKVIYKDEDLVGVQLTGYAVFPYSGTAPTVGIGMLAADGEGGVKTDETNGREYLITDVNTTAQTVGIIL